MKHFHNKKTMKKILVLDDDTAMLEVLEATLEYASFSVKTAVQSDAIFNEIKEFTPDLVLVDYILNGVNGGEICHQIKCNPDTSHIPVILISAFPRVLLSLGDYGCNAFIPKPFELLDLVEQINTCIHSSANP